MEKEIIITNDASEVINITRFVEDLRMSLLLPPFIGMNLCLALEETISSIIRHAYPHKQKGKIKLKASFVNGDITFFISNDGVLFDPTLNTDTPSPQFIREILIGDPGFFLVYRTMDEITYHTTDGTNYLMLTKRINATEEPQSSLRTNICKIEDTLLLTIEGRLDTANARQLETIVPSMLSRPETNIIINCKELTFISSSGLRCFILLQKGANSKQKMLTIDSLSPEIKKIFDMTGCMSIFKIN